jgi:hypothetical protein
MGKFAIILLVVALAELCEYFVEFEKFYKFYFNLKFSILSQKSLSTKHAL